MKCNAMPFSRPDPFLPGRHRALVGLRCLLNNLQMTLCFRKKHTTLCHLTTYICLAETGEILGLGRGDDHFEGVHHLTVFNFALALPEHLFS